MLSWHSVACNVGVQVVSDDGDWTVLMINPLTLEWKLFRNKERAGLSYRESHSLHTRLDQAQRAAQDAADEETS